MGGEIKGEKISLSSRTFICIEAVRHGISTCSPTYSSKPGYDNSDAILPSLTRISRCRCGEHNLSNPTPTHGLVTIYGTFLHRILNPLHHVDKRVVVRGDHHRAGKVTVKLCGFPCSLTKSHRVREDRPSNLSSWASVLYCFAQDQDSKTLGSIGQDG